MVSMIYFQRTAWGGNENHPETVRTGTGHAKVVCSSCSRSHLVYVESFTLVMTIETLRISPDPPSGGCCAAENLDDTYTTWFWYASLQLVDCTCVAPCSTSQAEGNERSVIPSADNDETAFAFLSTTIPF